MEDVKQARFLIEQIGEGRSVGEIIYSAYEALAKLYPHKGDAKKQWTERRLRAWWNGETDVVRFWQMMELYEAARAVSDEEERINKARKEHAEFIEKTATISALVEQRKADFDCR